MMGYLRYWNKNQHTESSIRDVDDENAYCGMPACCRHVTRRVAPQLCNRCSTHSTQRPSTSLKRVH